MFVCVCVFVFVFVFMLCLCCVCVCVCVCVFVFVFVLMLCLCCVCVRVVTSVVVPGYPVLPSYLQVSVELHTNEKTITIPVGQVRLVDEKDQRGPTAASAGRRPDTPSHTPSSMGRY